jgi:hypothetical protein
LNPGDAQARQRVGQHVPRVLDTKVASSANLKLSRAYFVLAREHGFPSWPALQGLHRSASTNGRAD